VGLRLYDVLLIVDPRPTEEEVAQLSSRLQELLVGLGGEVVSIENWGKRRLTFEIRKQREGQYLLLQIRSTPPVIREYERQLRLNEAILRFMTTRVVERRRAPAPPPSAEAVAQPEPETPVSNEVG